MRFKNKGFTLSELMIVVAIIAILSTAAVYFFGQNAKKARIVEGVAQITSLAGQLEEFRLKNGNYKDFGDKEGQCIYYSNDCIYKVDGIDYTKGNRYEITIKKEGGWIREDEEGCKININGNGDLKKESC